VSEKKKNSTPKFKALQIIGSMGMLCDSTQDVEIKECVAPVSNNTFGG
jgi:hypothetical protein